MHYRRWVRHGDPTVARGPVMSPWVNPLVCVCTDPVCDGIGMCQSCKRKPVALMTSGRDARAVPVGCAPSVSRPVLSEPQSTDGPPLSPSGFPAVA
jgi:hypothetical protein